MIDFMIRGSSVKRFHAHSTIQENTVAHHSHGVAMLLWVMTLGMASAELIMAGIMHDMGEQRIGDIPAPTKRLLGDEAKNTLNQIEAEFLLKNGFRFILNEDEERLLKLADCMDGMVFCISERRLGNQNVKGIFFQYKAYIQELGGKCPNLLNEILAEWEKADGS